MRTYRLLPAIASALFFIAAPAIAATPCTSDNQCPQDSFCAKAEGDCDGTGQCQEKPLACPEIYDPVCGCDDVTYSNACEAAAASTTIDHDGPCSTQCGGFAGIPCEEGEYCNLDGCYPDAMGQCEPVPSGCPEIWDPVCGCDGKTYANDCEAAAAQMSLRHDGECSTTQHCTDNAQCPATSYCSKADGDCGGNGQCQEKPLACPDIWAPVCGCDGITYGNSCEAAAAGMNVDHNGACPPPGPTIVMRDPNVAPDDVHTGPSGVRGVRILWSESLVFALADITIINEHGMPIGFLLTGNTTNTMTITFRTRLVHDRYTITIADSVVSLLTGLPIDGDNNGAAGGDAVIVMEHRMRTDSDNNNRIDFRDVALWFDTWLAELD